MDIMFSIATDGLGNLIVLDSSGTEIDRGYVGDCEGEEEIARVAARLLTQAILDSAN